MAFPGFHIDALNIALLAFGVYGAPVIGICRREESISAADVKPVVGEDSPAVPAVGRPAPRAVVLQPTIYIIGIAHVGADGVKLADGKVVKEDVTFAVIVRQGGSAVIADIVTVFVVRIRPQGMVVAMNAGVLLLQGFSAIGRDVITSGHDIYDLVIDRIQEDVAVIERAVVVAVHVLPGSASVFCPVDAGSQFGHIFVVRVIFPIRQFLPG